MTKKLEPGKPVNFSSFTKAELIRTIKKLDKRQTQLLNEVAALQSQLMLNRQSATMAPLFPWERDA